MKKITLITLGQTGAGPVYSLEMAKALALSNSCELQIIISEGLTNIEAWKSAFNGGNVDFNIVKAYNHSKLSVFFQFFNFRRKYHIVKLINRFNPDVLYVPFGLLWARFIFFFIRKRIKIVSTIHDVVSHDKFNFAEAVSKALTYGSKKVDGIVILNKKDKPVLESKSKKPVVVIPHASFSYYFNKCKQQRNNQIKSRIGFFGRIEPYKGLDLLVDAFEQSKTQGLKLLIAGSGAIEASLLERIQKNKDIELINRYIDDNEFQPLLDSVDFAVLPYIRASQSGVIPMCFAYGKTVIATNVGALEEQVPEGTGVITAPDTTALTKEIDRLYSKPELIEKYGNAAKLYAEKELSWDYSAELLLGFIDRLKK